MITDNNFDILAFIVMPQEELFGMTARILDFVWGSVLYMNISGKSK